MTIEIPADWREISDYATIKEGDMCRWIGEGAVWETITATSACLGYTGKGARERWRTYIFVTPSSSIFEGRIVDKEVFESLLDPWPEGFHLIEVSFFAVVS